MRANNPHGVPAQDLEYREAEEGVKFRFLSAPTEVLGTKSKVSGLKVEIMKD